MPRLSRLQRSSVPGRLKPVSEELAAAFWESPVELLQFSRDVRVSRKERRLVKGLEEVFQGIAVAAASSKHGVDR